MQPRKFEATAEFAHFKAVMKGVLTVPKQSWMRWLSGPKRSRQGKAIHTRREESWQNAAVDLPDISLTIFLQIAIQSTAENN